MKIEIVNRQTRLKPRLPWLRRLVCELLSRASRRANVADGTVVVILVDDAGMAEVNRACFGRDAVTDVITQAYEAIPGEAGGRGGELFVNVERAVVRGPRLWRGRSREEAVVRELVLYLAHACDHLHGGEDATPAGRARMRRRELRWIKALEAGGGMRNVVARMPDGG